MDVWIPSEAILVGKIKGTLDAPMAEWFLDISKPWMATPTRKRQAFQDWEEMIDYETSARVLFAHWTVHYRGSFQRIHLLVQSRILAMGAEMTGTASANETIVHKERGGFVAALREAAAREGITSPL